MILYRCTAAHPTCVCKYTKWRIITTNVTCRRTGARFMVEARQALTKRRKVKR